MTSVIKKFFTSGNFKKFRIVFLLSILKTILFLAYIIISKLFDKGFISLLLWKTSTNIPFSIKITMKALSFILIFLFLFSLVLRIRFAWKLRDDEIFRQSGLDIKQYSIGFGLIPLITSIILITKKLEKKKSINDFLITKQLIQKWKIINFFKDLIALVWIFVVLGFLVSFTFAFFEAKLDENIENNFSYIYLIILGNGIFFLLIPFFLLGANSLKIYRQIKDREQANWTPVSYIFFLPFLYLKAWKNIFKIEKEIKNTDFEKNSTTYLASKDKMNWLFYKFLVKKLVFHSLFLIVFTITLLQAITRLEILHNIGFLVSFFLLFTTTLAIYFFYICPCYLANLAIFIKKPKYWFLYILDFFIPTVSIYNLVKYRKNNDILM
ncbi:hypothetical protein DR095_00150 [Mycoplasma flocculare]|nr:hypothetical protein [Mesomycoplasma flocculare]